ncbi:hypothetical protein [Portibacter marinus]|uniref:hypothetical protein n=1 Tax=Portibacter marinus TaxID=2898660 RepID=UPI001F319702|nr:hypothetical protein [Portibacter marinus]
MLKTKVIASSISNLTDARYFAAWDVEAIGFDLQEISVMQVNAFKEWISGPVIIGQFSSIQDPESIQSVADNLDLDIIQLDHFSTLDWSFNRPVYKEVLIEEWQPIEADALILKSGNPHFSIEKNEALLTDICATSSCYLDLNISVESLDLILTAIKPIGIVLRGGAEEKVGFKSYDELDEIVEALEIN